MSIHSENAMVDRVEFSQKVDNLQFPVYADQFHKGIAKVKASGDKVKRIWGSTIYALAADGSEVQYNPERTDKGVEFFKKAIPAQKET